MSKIRILIADDQTLMRTALVRLLGDMPDFEVVGEADDGLSAVELTAKQCPDVVLMDVSLPTQNGIDATRQIVSRCPDTRVVALSMHEDDWTMNRMRDAGATAYVAKTGDMKALIAAIRGN